jgi:3-isopropylmalate/(R)-2-methylmalate dehydratase small subunit
MECPEAAAAIQKGDRITVDFKTGVIVDETQGKTFQAAPFPEFIDGIIENGGLMNSLKARGLAK